MSCLQSLSCTYLYKTKSNNQIDCTILVQTLSFCTSHSRLWIQNNTVATMLYGYNVSLHLPSSLHRQ